MRYLMTVLAVMSLLGTLAGVTPGTAQTKKPAATKKTATKKTARMMYECKMCHTKSAKPGNCPKCGMKMTAIKKGGKMDHSKMKMDHSMMPGMDKKK